jgi:hypothetical protein
MKFLFVCLIFLFALTLQQVQPVKSGQTEPTMPAKEPTTGEKPATETPKEPKTENPKEPATGDQEPTPTPTDPKNTPDTPTDPKIDKKCWVYKAYFNHLITGQVDTRRDVYLPMPKERATDEYKQRAIDHFKTLLKIDLSQDIEGIKLTPVELNPKLKSFIAAAYAEQLPKSLFLFS